MASEKGPRSSETQRLCPWTYGLTFRDSKLEDEFREAVATPADSSDVDSSLGVFVLLAIPARHIMSMEENGLEGLWLPAIVALLPALAFLAKCYCKSSAMCKCRPRVLAVGICLSIYFMELVTLQTIGKFWLAVHVVNRSCLVSLAFGKSGYRPFPVHVVIQMVGTCLSAVWTSGICTPSNPSLNDTINSLGFAMESILARFSTVGFPLDFVLLPEKYPCLLVVAFLHAWSGVIAPLVFQYWFEVQKRSSYLEGVGHFPHRTQNLKEFVNASLILGAVVFLVATQVLWFGFSTAAELAGKREELWCQQRLEM